MPIAENAMIAGNRSRYGTFRSFTQSPIIGRLRITRSALPIHMLAMRPQNSSGRVVITSGPGWMPWMVSAPSISAITPEAGRPSVSIGMNLHCASALLADSGPALDRAFAEARRILRKLLLQHVGRERGDRRSGAGQHAEERADQRAARNRTRGSLEVLARRHQVLHLFGEHLALFGVAQVRDN